MWLSSHGGTSSPSRSRPLSVAKISPVPGWKSNPTVLRSPVAKTSKPVPSGWKRSIAARRESFSLHTLQLEPTVTYMAPSGPKRTVRVEWPPPVGRSGTTTSSMPSATPRSTSKRTRLTRCVSPT